MHDSAFEHMRMCIDVYMRKNRHYDVLDLGSRKSVASHPTQRDLLAGYDVTYTGMDVSPGGNVDVVMKKPYRIPAKSNTYDIVMTNQVFEHIPFFWASFLEMCRVLKPGGLIFLVVPSRGQRHGMMDCWRYYPDSMRALAAFARMDLREMYVDLPPRLPNGRPNYAAIDNYWGDAVGVFHKPQQYSKLVRVIREALVWWCNRVGGIEHIQVPKERPRRRTIGRPAKQPSQGTIA